jgi:hypothetical protein
LDETIAAARRRAGARTSIRVDRIAIITGLARLNEAIAAAAQLAA